MKTTAKLLLHCPDQPGILAEVTNFITINKGNIVYLDQYVDHVENIFFMRIEWEIKDFFIPKNKIEDYFETLYAQKYEMKFRLYFSDVKPKMAIFVSKLSHCLFDMLARYTAGEWNVEIPLIISNHPDLQHVAERFGIPFYLFPITKENKMEQEKAETLVTYQAKGYGLKNVNDRIRLLYGENYGIHIFSSPDEGTTVIMKFPKEGRENEE